MYSCILLFIGPYCVSIILANDIAVLEITKVCPNDGSFGEWLSEIGRLLDPSKYYSIAL